MLTIIDCGSNSSTVITLLYDEEMIVDVGFAVTVSKPKSLSTSKSENEFKVTIPKL